LVAAGLVTGEGDGLLSTALPTLGDPDREEDRDPVGDRVLEVPGEGATTFRARTWPSNRMSALLAADWWISHATTLVPRVSHCLVPPTEKYVCCWLALDTALMARVAALMAPVGRLLRPTSTPLMKHRMPSARGSGWMGGGDVAREHHE
jgi:hypothetical protein